MTLDCIELEWVFNENTGQVYPAQDLNDVALWMSFRTEAQAVKYKTSFCKENGIEYYNYPEDSLTF